MFTRLIITIVLVGCLEPFPEYDDYVIEVEADAGVSPSAGQYEPECNGIPIESTQTNGRPCQNNAFGICRTIGTWQCLESGLVCQITNPPTATAEVCPREPDDVSLDEDCDGRTDEGCGGCIEGTQQACFLGSPDQRGVGECVLGRSTCGVDGTFGPCEGSGAPTAETCNLRDDDCDGAIDEGDDVANDQSFGCESACGVGRATCIDGQLFNCSSGEPQQELCNGEDDDCDGRTDEDPADLAGSCSISPPVNSCSTGRFICTNGMRTCEIDPNAPCDCQLLSSVSNRHYVCLNPLDQERAAEMCNTYNLGTLTQIETTAEHQAVFHALKALNLVSNIWLGGNREGNGIRWFSGTEANQTLVNPDDINAGAGRNRVELNMDNGLWNFRAFNASRSYICEAYCDANDGDADGFSDCNMDCDDDDPLINPARPEHVGDGIDNNCNGLIDEMTTELCGDGADNDGNGTIDEDGCLSGCAPMWFDSRAALVCDTARSWDDAKDICERYGSQLAEFRTQANWRHIWAWLSETHTPNQRGYFHGLRRVGADTFRFVGGDVIDESSPAWSSWANNQPDDYRQREDCAELWCNRESWGNNCAGTWNDITCWSNLAFICLAPQ